MAEGISPATGPGAELGSRSMEPETPAPRKRATPAAKRSAAPTNDRQGHHEKPAKARARKSAPEPVAEVAPPRKRTPAKPAAGHGRDTPEPPGPGDSPISSLSRPPPRRTRLPRRTRRPPRSAAPRCGRGSWPTPASPPNTSCARPCAALGPDAREWVDRMRQRYPGARDDALARLAVDEHIRVARRQGAGSAVAGPAGPWLGLGLRGPDRGPARAHRRRGVRAGPHRRGPGARPAGAAAGAPADPARAGGGGQPRPPRRRRRGRAGGGRGCSRSGPRWPVPSTVDGAATTSAGARSTATAPSAADPEC